MKIFEGIIISKGMSKTVVVEVTRRSPHPLYKKLIKISKKFKADNTGFEEVEIGNVVKIVETKPISKQKHFKIAKILSKESRRVKKDETANIEESEKVDTSISVKTKKSSKSAPKKIVVKSSGKTKKGEK